jgi:hypothetical protein
MIPISMKLIQRPPSAAEIYKQTQFGVAVGLTQTAKDGQAAVISALRSNFTLRGSWFQQNMRHGIKIKPATKYDLQAEIRTAAVPTDAVRRNKRLIIPRAQRPKGLGAKVFVLQSKHGPVLVQRITRGKNKGLRVLYGLERRVRIRKRSTFYEPIERTVKRNLNRNVINGINRAFATMRK